MKHKKELVGDLQELGLSLTKEHWNRIETYVETLLKWQQRINLTAVRDRRELLRLHFFESFWAANQFLEPSSALVDIGSGGGFPGMAIKLFRPELKITLVEKNLKKATFLRTLGKVLKLDVAIVAGPAESFPDWKAADYATCRALRPSKELLQTLHGNNVSFLHFRGKQRDEALAAWKVAAEQRFPLSRNRWVSLYVSNVSRETSIER